MFSWFDNVQHFWILALAAIAVTFILAIAPAVSGRLSRPTSIAFVVFIGLTLLAGRWPLFFIGQTLEFDESCNVGLAITMASHPIPWKSYDPATIGPIEIGYLALPRFLGLTPSYNSTHFLTWLLLWIMLACLYVFMRRFIDDGAARVATLPALLFFTLTFNSDFQQYATELCSMMLAAIALVAATWKTSSTRGVSWSAYIAGLCVGALPCAKTQSIPLGAAIAAVYIVATVIHLRAAAVRRVTLFVAGCFTLPVVILVAVVAGGASFDFYMSYIKMQSAYVAGSPTPFSFVFGDANFSEFVIVCIVVALAGFGLAAAGRSRFDFPLELRIAPLLGLGFLGVAMYMLFAPHKPWVHYVLFLVEPLTFLAAIGLGVAIIRLERPIWRSTTLIVTALLVTASMVRQAHHTPVPYVGNLAVMRDAPQTASASTMDALLHPGDRAAIWGLAPDLFVRTGAIMGTRDVTTLFQMDPNPNIDYFRQRFVSDITANRPEVFVDAVGPGQLAYQDRAALGYETIPALKAVVDADYSLVCETEGVRIFERRSDAGSLPGLNSKCVGVGGRRALSDQEVAALVPVSSPPALGNFDGVSSVGPNVAPGLLPHGVAAQISGWAADPAAKGPGTGLILIVDGKHRIDATTHYGIARPDVGAALKSTSYVNTGFQGVMLPASLMTRGAHTLGLGVVTTDRLHYYHLGDLRITVQ